MSILGVDIDAVNRANERQQTIIFQHHSGIMTELRPGQNCVSYEMSPALLYITGLSMDEVIDLQDIRSLYIIERTVTPK